MKLPLLLTFITSIAGQRFSIPSESEEKGHNFWMNSMKEDINDALRNKENNNIAKNIIMFIGDGMGVTVTTAGRVYKGQKNGNSGEETVLAWENFPNVAMLKTYNLDKQVPDSAATATAFFGGVKANYYTTGVTGEVPRGDCKASLLPGVQVSSVMQWAQEAGKDTGIVTTTRITHATPAALYAHTAERYWECDSELNQTVMDAGCKDIAAQLVENAEGLNANVIFAGGRQQLGAALATDQDYSCSRYDSRNLVKEWLDDKTNRGLAAQYVTNTGEFTALDVNSLDNIIGLFGGGHQPYELERDQSPVGTPSIKDLTITALTRLQRSTNGYFLMVEGGRIDHGLHDTKPKHAMEDIVAFDEAVQAAIDMVGDDEETLFIVTADHSHVMTMNGYPQRGNNILGVVKENDALDEMPYPTLMFTIGPGYNFTEEGGEIYRLNLTDVDTTADNFISPALVPVDMGYETHGGEDVSVHAKGPMAHLFQKTHEQSYVAHVVGYAACMGPYKDDCGMSDRGENVASLVALNILLYTLSLSIAVIRPLLIA